MRLQAGPTGLLRACGETMTIIFRTMLAAVGHGWRERRSRRHLEALPDFMLKDIGISRSDIDYVATHSEIRGKSG